MPPINSLEPSIVEQAFWAAMEPVYCALLYGVETREDQTKVSHAAIELFKLLCDQAPENSPAAETFRNKILKACDTAENLHKKGSQPGKEAAADFLGNVHAYIRQFVR